MGIKQARLKAGITQVELANRLGVKQSAVANWETGINHPKAVHLLAMAKILKCKIDNLLKDNE